MSLKDNVKVVNGKPKAVLGENDRVTGLELADETLGCDGIFFAKTLCLPKACSLVWKQKVKILW